MTKLIYKAEIFAEGDRFVGMCRELDLSSFGDTPDDARASLQETVEAFLENCEHAGRFDEVLSEFGFEKKRDVWKLREQTVAEGVATIPTHTRVANGNKRKRILGLHPGSMWMSYDFDAPLPDEFWLGKS